MADIIDARHRFPTTRAPRDIAGSVGRLRSKRPMTDEAARTFGRRRLGFMAAPLAVGLLVAGVAEGDRSANDFNQRVEACAGAIVGHEVHLAESGDGTRAIPAELAPVVDACQLSRGNVEEAKINLKY